MCDLRVRNGTFGIKRHDGLFLTRSNIRNPDVESINIISSLFAEIGWLLSNITVEQLCRRLETLPIVTEETLGLEEFWKEQNALTRKRSIHSLVTHGHILYDPLLVDFKYESMFILDVTTKCIELYENGVNIANYKIVA